MCQEEPMSTQRQPQRNHRACSTSTNTAMQLVTLRLWSVVLIVNTLSTLAKVSVTDLLFLSTVKVNQIMRFLRLEHQSGHSFKWFSLLS